MKAFPQFTREYIRTGISYINLIYLLKTIAPYRKDGKEDKGKRSSNTEGSTKQTIKPQNITHFEQFRF